MAAGPVEPVAAVRAEDGGQHGEQDEQGEEGEHRRHGESFGVERLGAGRGLISVRRWTFNV
jgi:hypothetical protein